MAFFWANEATLAKFFFFGIWRSESIASLFMAIVAYLIFGWQAILTYKII